MSEESMQETEHKRLLILAFLFWIVYIALVDLPHFGRNLPLAVSSLCIGYVFRVVQERK